MDDIESMRHVDWFTTYTFAVGLCGVYSIPSLPASEQIHCRGTEVLPFAIQS